VAGREALTLDLLRSWPYPVTVAVLFVIVMLRANATYWLGRAARAGAGRTPMQRVLGSTGFDRAQALVARWGAPVVSLSFLTIGIQSLVNVAAGAARMPIRRYLPAAVVGSIAWAFLYATAGFVTFEAWLALYRRSPPTAVVAILLLAAAVVALATWRTVDRPVTAGSDSRVANVGG
jgi:membrane protein DedA with SNARE-associated domain